MTQSSERQDQTLTQAQIDSLRQGQRLEDRAKPEVTLDAVMLEVEGKRGKPGARNKADTPKPKLFPLTSATLPK